MTIAKQIQKVQSNQGTFTDHWVSTNAVAPFAEHSERVLEQASLTGRIIAESGWTTHQVLASATLEDLERRMASSIQSTTDQVYRTLQADAQQIVDAGILDMAVLMAWQFSASAQERQDLAAFLSSQVLNTIPFHQDILIPLRDRFDTLKRSAVLTFEDHLRQRLPAAADPEQFIIDETDIVMGIALQWLMNMTDLSIWGIYKGGAFSTIAQYRDNLEGWMWWAKLDSKTCPSCVSLHRRVFPFSEVMNDHPHGRCIPVPLVENGFGIFNGVIQPIPDGLTGEDWFRVQSEKRQLDILGGAKFRAYKAGAISVDDFSAISHNPVHGSIRRAASLKEILGDDASQYYK